MSAVLSKPASLSPDNIQKLKDSTELHVLPLSRPFYTNLQNNLLPDLPQSFLPPDLPDQEDCPLQSALLFHYVCRCMV